MKTINLALTLTTLDGAPMLDAKKEPVTAGDTILQVLLMDPVPPAQGKPVPPDAKLNLWKLAQRVAESNNKNEPLEISAEEGVLLKAQAQAHCSITAYGRIHDLIEKEDEPTKE